MRNILPIFLFLLFVTNAHAQGGNTCAAAMASPLAPTGTYNNQSTCGDGNNYTGSNACLLSSYFGGEDWYYYVCAPSSGYFSINLTNVTSGVSGTDVFATLMILNGCPGTGTCEGFDALYIPAGTSNSMQANFSAHSGECFYIVLDSYSPGFANCFNYDLSISFQASGVSNGCSNTGFDNVNLNNWFCAVGNSAPASPGYGTPMINITSPAPTASSHVIVTGGIDACTGQSKVFPGAGGAPASLRLEDDSVGGNSALARHAFIVTPSSSLLTYSYMIAFEDAQHGAADDPYFRAVVNDSSGNPIQCSEFYIAPAINDPGVLTSIQPCSLTVSHYIPWTSVDVDLSQYLGQEVTLEFTVGDCTPGGHMAYAYVDANCSASPMVGNNDTICAGQCITLQAPSGHASYLWMPGNLTTQNINVCPGSTTTYTLTLTTLAGCVSTHSFTVNVVNTIPLSVTQTNGCGACNSSISVTPLAGASPHTFLWSNGQTSSTITGLCAGVYSVTVSSPSGCSGSGTYTVSVSPSVSVTLSSSVSASCGSNNGSATISGTGGSGTLSYSWNTVPLQTGPTATGLAAGNYIVTVTDASGCTATLTVSIASAGAPNITTAALVNVSCFGQSTGSFTANTSTGAAPYDYVLMNGATTVATFNNAGTSQNFTGLAAGAYNLNVTDNNGCQGTTTITITQPASAVSLTLSSSTSASCGSANGSATVGGSGGTGSISYTWNTIPAQTGPTAIGLAAGSYTVTATDANGCATTLNVIINNTGGATASVSSQTNVLCFAQATGSATITASGGTGALSYSWNTIPVQTGATATGLVAATYVCTVTDANGCVTPVSVTITQPSAAVSVSLSSSTPASCGASNGSATVSGSGGTGAIGYSWNTVPVQTGTTATGLPAGTYNVTATDANSCTATLTVNITSAAAPTASLISSTPASCATSNGSATVSGTGGTGTLSYSWNTVPVQSTSTATGLAAGTYTCIVSDANGCTASVSVTINSIGAPSASISAQTNVLCNGGATGTATATGTGGTGTLSYLWNTTPPQTGTTATGLTAGTYTVTVTDGSGCATTANVTITQPAAINISTTATNATCTAANGSASATVSGGTGAITYSWNTNPSQTTSTATGLVAGTYTLTITDGNGCVQTQTVVVNTNNPLTLSASSTQTKCSPATGTATANPANGTAPYSFQWSNGQNTQTLNSLAAGTYSVTVTDANGCVQTQATTVSTYPNPIASASVSVATISLGDSTLLSAGGGGSYNWIPSADVNCASCQNTTLVPDESGTYCVLVTDTNGCTDTACVYVKVNVECKGELLDKLVPNAFSPNGDQNNDNYCIPYTPCVTSFLMKVYDRWGEKVFESQRLEDCWNGEFRNTILPPGVYVFFYEATLSDGSSYSKKGNITLVR